MRTVSVYVIEKRVKDHYEFCNILNATEDIDQYIESMCKLHRSYMLELDEGHLQIHKFGLHKLDDSCTTLRVTTYSFEIVEAVDL